MFEGQARMGIDPPTTVMTCISALPMRSTRLWVSGIHGMHLRVAADLAKAAQEFHADVAVESGGRRANAKSIIGIMTLGAGQGTCVTVTAEGSDADRAIRAIEKLFACFEVRSGKEP